MKIKSFCLAVAVSFSAFASAREMTIELFNEDIGPVKGGSFLKEQEWVLKHGKGKAPGSGLFNFGTKSTFEDCLPLFDIKPNIQFVTLSGSTLIETSEHLGLPGTKISVQGNYQGPLSGVLVSLTSQRFGFTTGGGSLWVRNARPTVISNTLFIPRAPHDYTSVIKAACSWPSLEGLGKDSERSLHLKEIKTDPDFKSLKLVSNWKSDHLGMNTHDFGDEAHQGRWCFPARGFNRVSGLSGKGLTYLAESYGNSFSIIAGHSADDWPYVDK